MPSQEENAALVALRNPLHNKRLKEGLSFADKFTGQLRMAVDIDKPLSYFQPLEVFTCGEPLICKGEAVSIVVGSQIDALKDLLGPAYDPHKTYVTRTDTRIHDKAVGLALEPASQDDDIHVFNQGSISLDAGNSLIYCDFDNWTEEDIGKTVWVQDYNADLNTAGNSSHADKIASKEPGKLTVTEDQAFNDHGNIIQIGHIKNIQRSPDGTKTQHVELSIQIEGDHRGPIDSTQFEVLAGENFTALKDFPVKVFAIGQEEARCFKAVFRYVAKPPYIPLTNDFFTFYQPEGETLIYTFRNTANPPVFPNIPNAPSSFVSEQDIAVLNFLKDYSQNITVRDFNMASSVTGNNVILLKNTVENAFRKTLGKLCGDNQFTILPAILYDEYDAIKEIGFTLQIESTVPVPLVSFYCSSNIWDMCGRTLIYDKGSLESKGKAIVADARYTERNNTVLGVYFSNYYNNEKYIQNDRFLVLSKGLYTVPKASSFSFETGREYFLGENGHITGYPRRDIPYSDLWVKIGVAQNPKQLLVDISQFYFDRWRGEFPVGHAKPLVSIQNPDYGYLAADGSVRVPVDQYPELYGWLKNYFSDAELQVSEDPIDSNGASAAPVDGSGLIIPEEP